MNDTQEKRFNFPVDSLGRRIGIVNKFSLFNEKMLDSMRVDLSLNMNLDELKFCKEHYSKAKQTNITLSELYFLDSLSCGVRLCASNLALTEINTDSKEIIETYKDLFSKHTQLCGENPPPLTLDSAASVSSKYMRSIGLTHSENQGSISATMPENTAFLIVTASGEANNYHESLSMLINDERIRSRLLCVKEIDFRGIAYALAEISSGIYADIFSIPTLPSPPELSYLATECHGKVIIAINKQNLSEISEVALEYGLCATYFAKAINGGRFILLSRDNISMSIDISLIRALGRSLHGATVDIPKASHAYFYEAADKTISALLPQIAEGADRKDILLSPCHSISNHTDRLSLGRSLSSILGAYRVVCEFCVPTQSSVKYENISEPLLSISASGKSALHSIPSRFTAPHNAVYLLSFNRCESGLPDFSSFRAMYEYYRSCISDGTVKSAKAVCGRLSETITEMEADNRFIPEQSALQILEESFFGIILETDLQLSSGILLGALVQNDDSYKN